jgi:LPS sulfotransferase NodH
MESTPGINYLVCATHRSGSNLLCQALWHTGLCGYPQEFFSPTRAEIIAGEHALGMDPESDYLGYLRALRVKRATPNGVFGGKIMWPHLALFSEQLRKSPGFDASDKDDAALLREIFPGLRCIWMRRDDTLRQAISLWKAKQTNVYNSLQEGEVEPSREPCFDYEEIRKIVERFHKQDAAWGAFFNQNGITPFEVHYETFVERYEQTTAEIVEFLGIAVPSDFRVEPLTYKKLSDGVNEEWRRQFLETEGVPLS